MCIEKLLMDISYITPFYDRKNNNIIMCIACAFCLHIIIIIGVRANLSTNICPFIYIYTHIIIIYCERRKWMKIPPPVVKIIVSVRSPAGVIYDRGSRVLADQWAKLWGLGSLYAHSHTLYVYNISMCVCVCHMSVYRVYFLVMYNSNRVRTDKYI